MSEEIKKEEVIVEEKNAYCKFCNNKYVKQFIVVVLGSFVGGICALSLFAAVNKPPVMMPKGPHMGMGGPKMERQIHKFHKGPRYFNGEFKKQRHGEFKKHKFSHLKKHTNKHFKKHHNGEFKKYRHAQFKKHNCKHFPKHDFQKFKKHPDFTKRPLKNTPNKTSDKK